MDTFFLSLTQSFCCIGCPRYKLWLLCRSLPLYPIFFIFPLFDFAIWPMLRFLISSKNSTKIRLDYCIVTFLRLYIIIMVNKLFHFISFHFFSFHLFLSRTMVLQCDLWCLPFICQLCFTYLSVVIEAIT